MATKAQPCFQTLGDASSQTKWLDNALLIFEPTAEGHTKASTTLPSLRRCFLTNEMNRTRLCSFLSQQLKAPLLSKELGMGKRRRKNSDRTCPLYLYLPNFTYSGIREMGKGRRENLQLNLPNFTYSGVGGMRTIEFRGRLPLFPLCKQHEHKQIT